MVTVEIETGEVNRKESEQNDVDGINKGADFRGIR